MNIFKKIKYLVFGEKQKIYFSISLKANEALIVGGIYVDNFGVKYKCTLFTNITEPKSRLINISSELKDGIFKMPLTLSFWGSQFTA